MATAGMDGVVKVWKSSDGSLQANLEGPGEDITFISWHSKGDVILAGSSDASVWMWNAISGACMAVLSGSHTRPSSLSLALVLFVCVCEREGGGGQETLSILVECRHETANSTRQLASSKP